jgi:hypothetical protein
VVGEGSSKDTEEDSGWGEKESRRANAAQKAKLTTPGEPQRTETQKKIIPMLGLAGPRGRISSRFRTHRGQWWFFSSGDPLHYGRRSPEESRDLRGGVGKEHGLLSSNSSVLLWGRTKGTWEIGAKGKEGWFCTMKCCLYGKWESRPSLAWPQALPDYRSEDGRNKGLETFPFLFSAFPPPLAPRFIP